MGHQPPVSPATYFPEKMGYRPGLKSTEHIQPVYTVSETGKGGGRPLPRARTAADHLGPDIYTVPNKWDALGARKSEKLLRAAKLNKKNWAEPQYNHIFGRIKPAMVPKSIVKSSSEPHGLHKTR